MTAPASDPVAPAVLAIDPGSDRSARLILDGDQVLDPAITPNGELVAYIRDLPVAAVVIETIEPWGGFTGPPALETMRWVGRFQEAAYPAPVTLVKRSAVLRALGIGKVPKGQAQAAVRALLLDMWGGGNPVRRDHPLNGVRADVWSSLAAAVAYREGLR